MKKLLLLTFLLIPLKVHAGMFAPDRVYQVGVSSVTLFKIAVSTGTAAPTKMDNPVQPERVAIEIQNIDGTANLWCTPGIAVSTSPVNGSRKITPGNSWVISMLDKFYVPSSVNVLGKATVNVYCTSDGAALTTNAIVIQIH